MVDTVRTLEDLLTNVFQDGQADGSISAQDIRDLLVSIPVRSRTTILTAADLADLHNTPNGKVELVPSAGANKVLMVLQIQAVDPSESGFIIGQTYFSYTGNGPDIFASGDVGLGTGMNYFPSDGGDFYNDNSLSFLVDQGIYISVSNPIAITGAILTTSIGAAGTGYVAADEIYIGDAVITVDTVGGGGEVLTYTVTTAGTNNILGDLQATTTNSALGADFTLDIDSLDYSVNPMTLKVKVIYSIFDVS
jgi:hypothetical protein